MTDQELIQTSKQAMEDLWNSNNGKLLDYEQTAYNCLRLLCERLGENTSPNLADVKWLQLGTTDEYKELKERIAHICHDVTEAACIKEICIHDIVYTFRQFGYEVYKK